MPSKNHTPKDLAQTVYSELRRLKLRPPKLEILIALFESMYYASLRAEESQRIAFDLIYVNPHNPDPDPPPYISNDRWKYTRLANPIPMTISNLVKIAKASDHRTSSFVAYPDARGLMKVWGLIDQGKLFYDYANHDSDGYFAPPGLFQASIAGIGHLVAYKGMAKIAELKLNGLVRPAENVLREGPIHDGLQHGFETHLESIRHTLPKYSRKELARWIASLQWDWTLTLCRLLLRVQNYRQGGAILITPDTRAQGLNVKYRLHYTRLPAALKKYALLQIKEYYKIHLPERLYRERSVKKIPLKLHRDQLVLRGQKEANKSELDGTIWFISLLTRVDGLVLLKPNLEVRGFGVEIMFAKEPSKVFIASDRQQQKVNYAPLITTTMEHAIDQ